MNKINLLITDKAISDMELIANYISKDSKTAAVKMLKFFEKSFDTLCNNPEIGIKRPDFTYKNIMFFIVKKHYLIVYKTDKSNLVVLRVLSAYQDICSLL